MLDQNEMEEQSLRDKISQYFKLRSSANESGIDSVTDDTQLDEEGSLNYGAGKRNPAPIRVRDMTRRSKVKALKGLAVSYLSE